MTSFFIFLAFSAFSEDSRQKIVVLDTAANTEQLSSDFICEEVRNPKYSTPHSHGVNIVGLISDRMNKKKYCIYPIAMYLQGNSLIGYRKALKKAKALKNVAAYNLSISSNGNDKYSMIPLEYSLAMHAVVNDVKFNVAIGNEGRRLGKGNCHIYPSCLFHKIPDEYKHNFNVIASPRAHSNSFIDTKTYVIDGYKKGIGRLTGTSQATAIFTGRMFSK